MREILRTASTSPRSPAKLYVDWCHPEAEGHLVLAKALCEQINAPAGEIMAGDTSRLPRLCVVSASP